MTDSNNFSLIATLRPDDIAGLTYEMVQPSEALLGPPPLLVLLHGAGSNEHDLLGLTPYLDGRCCMVSVRAPFQNGAGGFAWYRTAYTASGAMIDEEQEAASRDVLARFVSEIVRERGAHPANVYLLGFSQGATMALSLLLSDPGRYAGAMAFGARLLPQISGRVARRDLLKGKPLLLGHGVLDDVVPVARARGVRSFLLDAGMDLDYREYATGHDIPGAALRDAAAWLSTRLENASLAPRVLQS
ncbi:MAG: alpha/beta fold hydrolase [Betaproteobacteria bacterium]|nr:alpha/beta fold hydrolase [Betaproteobacteria bacterium]